MTRVKRPIRTDYGDYHDISEGPVLQDLQAALFRAGKALARVTTYLSYSKIAQDERIDPIIDAAVLCAIDERHLRLMLVEGITGLGYDVEIVQPYVRRLLKRANKRIDTDIPETIPSNTPTPDLD